MKEKIVKQRTDCDCMVASMAMLLGWTYEQMAEYFPPKAVKETGYTWQPLIDYLRRAARVYLVWFPPEMISHVDWSKPAVVDVPSLNSPERGDHIIYWDGEKVIDPGTKEKVYTSLPDKSEIMAVYQRKILTHG